MGLEEVPTDDKAKVLASTASTNLMSDQKNQYNNYKMNTRAYADLLQCCIQDVVSFGIIDTAKDKNLANGNSALTWKRLSKKFAGRNNAEKMKLIKEFNESRMKKMKTLTYGSRTWNICDRELQNVDDELIMHILYHLPSEYDNLNDQYLKDLDDEKAIYLEDLRADLRADLQCKYNRLMDLGHIENSD